MQESMCALIHIVDYSDNIVSLINGIWNMDILDNYFKNVSDTMFVNAKKRLYTITSKHEDSQPKLLIHAHMQAEDDGDD